MTLGKNISKLMKEKGYTVRNFAKRINMSPSYLSDIRNDRQDPSLKKLKDIAEALNADVYELLKTYRIDMDEKSGVKEEDYTYYYTNKEKELIGKYRKLDERQKAKLEGIIEGMLMSNNDSVADKKGAWSAKKRVLRQF